MALSRSLRLPLRQERSQFESRSRSFSGDYFTLAYASSAQSSPRFAILVTKKSFPLAVDRQLIKRQISSLIEKQLPSIKTADYLIIPKRHAHNIAYPLLEKDLLKLLDHVRSAL